MNHLLDKIIEAGKQGGWILALIVAVAALGFSAIAAFNPVGEAGETVFDVFASPAENNCPSGWQTTEGDDPHAGPFKACTSPDGRYIMQISDGTKTTLDQESGQFVDSGQFP